MGRRLARHLHLDALLAVLAETGSRAPALAAACRAAREAHATKLEEKAHHHLLSKKSLQL